MVLITVMRVIMGVPSGNGNIVVVDVTNFASCFQLTQQGTRGVNILSKCLCYLPRTHALWKLFGEQVQDFLSFLGALDLLDIAYLHPHGRERIESECDLLLLLNITT